MTSSETMNQKDRVGTFVELSPGRSRKDRCVRREATELRSAESTVNHGAEWRRGQASFECGRSEDTTVVETPHALRKLESPSISPRLVSELNSRPWSCQRP